MILIQKKGFIFIIHVFLFLIYIFSFLRIIIFNDQIEFLYFQSKLKVSSTIKRVKREREGEKFYFMIIIAFKLNRKAH